jgi:nucleoside 2-deoxyribosyltransferase
MGEIKMSNNVYIAGSCKNRKAIKHLMVDIENWGYKVTFDWTIRAENNENLFVEEDIGGMKECDSFIFCIDGSRSRGKYFELGYATALGKRIGIYLVPTYYHVTNGVCSPDIPPFDFIIENDSIFIKSKMYPIFSDANELKKWLSMTA